MFRGTFITYTKHFEVKPMLMLDFAPSCIVMKTLIMYFIIIIDISDFLRLVYLFV